MSAVTYNHGLKNFSTITPSVSSDNTSIDETVASYHHTFCQFTGNYNGIWDVVNQIQNINNAGSKARQKLKNLSKIHFSELSTDVYDELIRRVDPSPHETQFLAPRENIHRKRNQARQKLAMLSPVRFNDLATDILYEIERRYPNLRADPPEEYDNRGVGSTNNAYNGHGHGHTNSSINNPINSLKSPALSESSPSSSPYLNSRPFSNGSQISNATSRYTSDEYQPSMPLRRSSLTNQNQNQTKKSPNESSNNSFSPITSPSLPSSSSFTQGHNYNNSSYVPPPQKEVSIPPSNRSTPLAQPIKTTTIIPTKSVLVEEDDDDEDEMEEDNNVDEADNILNGSIRNSKRISLQLSDIEEEGDRLHSRKLSHDSHINIGAELKDKEEQIQMLVNEGSRMDETINQLEGQLNESETLKSTLVEENNRLHDMVGELEDQRQKAVEDKDSFEERLNELRRELDTSTNTIANHETTITNLTTEKSQALEESAKIQALVDELREEHVSLSELQSTVDDLKEQNMKHVNTIADYEEKVGELTKELDNVNEVHERELNEQKSSHEQSIDQLKSSHEQSIDQLKSSHEQSIDQLKSLHEQTIDQLKSSHEQSVDQLQSSHDQTIVVLNVSHQKELGDLITTRSQSDSQSHSKLEQDYNSLKQQHSIALTKQNEYAESTATLTNDYLLLQNKLSDYENTITSLKQQLEAKSSDPELQAKYNHLSNDHSDLQRELSEQHKITEQVRQEAKEFLVEMRALAESQQNLESAESLASQVHALKVEAQEWKSRYSRVKAQVRNLRNSTYGSLQTPSFSLNKESPHISVEGRVRDVSVTKFQIAVDEFLTKARLGTSDLLDNLHNVVIATRHITQDLNSDDSDLTPISEKVETDLAQCATLVSKTANQLISTARNHRISGGLAPISVLDAVTSDLSFAVIELIKVAKVRPSPKTDSSFTTRTSRMSGNSILVSPTDLHPVVTPTEELHLNHVDENAYINFNIEDPDNTIAELQGYLEEQTASAIDSIQSLLTGIKEGSKISTLRHNMLDIIKLVDITVIATNTSMKQTKNWLLKEKGSYILENLRDCSQRMAQLQEETKNINGESNPDRQLKQRLAGIAFDMAKFTKELVKTVEEVGLTSEINHIENQLR